VKRTYFNVTVTDVDESNEPSETYGMVGEDETGAALSVLRTRYTYPDWDSVTREDFVDAICDDMSLDDLEAHCDDGGLHIKVEETEKGV